MTGLEITLGVAFIAAVVVAVWFARLTAKITSSLRILWTKHEKLISAAVDLDLQVSDCQEIIHEANDVAELASLCLDIIDVADADMAVIETNLAYIKMMNSWERELRDKAAADREKAVAQVTSLKAELVTLKAKHILAPRCGKCGKSAGKAAIDMGSHYLCQKCKEKIAEPFKMHVVPHVDRCPSLEATLVDLSTAMAGDIAYLSDGTQQIIRDRGFDLVLLENCTRAYYYNGACSDPDLPSIVRWETCTEPATPADLTNAPFEGLEGVKEGDSVLFSDGVVRKVTELHGFPKNRIFVSPVIANVKGEPCAFSLSNGKNWSNLTPIHAIRLATPLDMKLYQFADDSKEMEKPATDKPLLADAKVGWICEHQDAGWSQINDVKDGKYHTDIEGHGIFKADGMHCSNLNCDYRITHTEPLATEGSAEWAWQMWCLLGKEIEPENCKTLTYRDLYPDKRHISMIYGKSADYWKANKAEWLSYAKSSRWQIYVPKKGK